MKPRLRPGDPAVDWTHQGLRFAASWRMVNVTSALPKAKRFPPSPFVRLADPSEVLPPSTGLPASEFIRLSSLSLVISPTSPFPLFTMEALPHSKQADNLQTLSAAEEAERNMIAVHDFTSTCLASIPAHWVSEMLEARGLPTAMPMGGWLFMIADEWIATRLFKRLSDSTSGDVEQYNQTLVDEGWHYIPQAHLYALEVDGQWLLGIDGFGYCFFEAHWKPLYELLELEW